MSAPSARRPELPPGTDHSPQPRRDDCPWCGSRRLRVRALDQCRDCAHVFRNPRPTARRPAQRHRDAPEPRRGARRLRSVARAMLPFPEPESWLDVGTGDGRFPQAARTLFPYTSFDGVDPGHRVERAHAAGRVEEAYRAHLANPRLTARLSARYDVVSMLHHLQHTPDPRAELRAAVAVLRPGGHLLLELPDPRCAFGVLLGKWWPPHARTRALHLPPLDNVRAELEALGCAIVTTDRRAPHTPHDLSGALSLALGRSLPSPAAAWAGFPVVAAARVLDHVLAPLLRHTRFSNAYRVIARKEAPAP